MPASTEVLRVGRRMVLAVAILAAPGVPAQTAGGAAEAPITERIGGAIRGFFQSIFGSREGELPPPVPRNEEHVPRSAATLPTAPPAPTGTAAEGPAKPAAPVPAAVTATPEAQASSHTLHSAIAKGDYASAMKMIEQGTDIEMKDPGAGASALHYAVMKGALPMVGLLLQRGADVNSRTRSGTTPLHTAVLYGHFEVAEYLLDKGADVNAKSSSGVTPLALALAANFQRIEKLLRGRGAQ